MPLRLILLIALLGLGSPPSSGHAQSAKSAGELPARVATAWFELLYDVVKAEKTPPAGSRVYGIVAVALYESIVDGTKANRSLVGQLNGLTSVPRPNNDRQQ